MKKLLLLFLLFVIGCSSNSVVKINNEVINVEIADNVFEQEKGLMFRDDLCDSCGMLFVYDDEEIHSFWMKNTFIPLDMIFIDSNFTIVDFRKAVPCDKDPCTIYIPKFNSKYVLEVNPKFDNSIVGQKVIIS